MRHVLSPDRVKHIYESKIKRLAKIKWQEAGEPERRDLEFWLSAEKEQRDKDMRFFGALSESALPNYDNVD